MDYTIKNKYLTVVAGDAGAELHSIKSADGTEYLWQADPKVWRDQAPNIFPYVARLTQGSFVFSGREYHMKIHGLLKYRTLQAEKHTENSITFRLDSDAQTREQYPFDFIYRITYTLQDNTLLITSSVENTGTERMYFAVGGHPGFRVPLEDGLAFEDYYLEFAQPARPYRVGFTDTCFLTGTDTEYPLAGGRRIPLRHDLFDHDAVVLKHAAKCVKIASEKGSRSVTVAYPDFQYVGFWHKSGTEAPFVCVEPWSSLPSRDGVIEDFACQSDLISVAEGKTYVNTWSITVE